jgi:hypothetical protein
MSAPHTHWEPRMARTRTLDSCWEPEVPDSSSLGRRCMQAPMPTNAVQLLGSVSRVRRALAARHCTAAASRAPGLSASEPACTQGGGEACITTAYTVSWKKSYQACKPYLVRRDTLYSCEAYGMRPKHKEKQLPFP